MTWRYDFLRTEKRKPGPPSGLRTRQQWRTHVFRVLAGVGASERESRVLPWRSGVSRETGRTLFLGSYFPLAFPLLQHQLPFLNILKFQKQSVGLEKPFPVLTGV